MLLKYSQAQKRIKATGVGKPQRTAGGMVKLSSSLMTVVPKIHRKVIKVAGKRPTTIHRSFTALKREQIPVDPCENSNDSGLGFDHHLDYHHPPHHLTVPPPSALRFSDKETVWHCEEPPEVKRRRLEIKLESDDANDNFSFPETVRQPVPRAICVPLRRRALPVTLTSQLSAVSQDGRSQLVIACQPETQHRARYQTEGSRGAVKDRSGNGFPIVKLVGYDRPATLQVFIGTDQGRVAPHMFYQACRVSGKNSTPCVERKIDGTIVIEVDIEPTKEMVVTCDCVGILKERNVDVEHRFPEEGSGRNKKKSTRCRMVFRTTIAKPDGSQETLQVTSMPIVCTQPPGVPEICKKSLCSSNVRGGQELFILGKNFLKDTRVVFQEGEPSSPAWCQSVQPDKEFLQQSHLVCVVPPYQRIDIKEPLSVRLVVESSGKASEPHTFTYLPDNTSAQSADNNHTVLAEEGSVGNNSIPTSSANSGVFCSSRAPPPLLLQPESAVPYIATPNPPQSDAEKMQPMMMWDKHMNVMMPPPPPVMLPISVRRSSVHMIVPEPLDPVDLKTEMPEPSEPPKPFSNVSDLSSAQTPSMDTLHKYVTSSSLPSINVRRYLSDIEGKDMFSNDVGKPQLLNEIPRIMIPPQITINKPIFTCDSTNLLTTVEPILANQAAAALNGRDLSGIPSESQPLQGNLSVIVDSSMIQKKSPNSHLSQNQVPNSQHMGLNLMISSHLNKQTQSMTEKLDDFVNSAADSHISPTPLPSMVGSSIISENAVINSMSGVVNETNDLNKLQESNNSPRVQASSVPMNLTNSHQVAASMRSICSVLTPSTPQSHVDCINSPPLGNQSINVCQSEIIHSPPLLQKMQSNIQYSAKNMSFSSQQQISLENHLSSQSLTTSSQLNHEFNQLIQSQSTSNSEQPVTNLQSALDQVMNSSEKTTHSDLNINNIIQSPSSISTSQCQNIQNIHTSLEQQLTSEAITSAQINNNCVLNNLIQSSPAPSMTDTQTLNSFQNSLEHSLSNQARIPQQIDHSMSSEHRHLGNLSSVQGYSTLLNSQVCHEPINLHSQCLQQGNLSLNRIESVMDTTSQDNARETLPNLASFERHLSSQAIPSSPQDSVNQSQVFPVVQNSFDQQLVSQNLPPTSPFLGSMSPNTTNSTQVENQAQAVSDLQLSLNHLTSQVLSHQNGNHANDASQIQVVESQETHMISNLPASLGQRLTSEVMTLSQSDSVMTDAVQSNHNSINENLPHLRTSLDHFVSQNVNAVQTRHAESYTSNLHDPQGLNLANSVSLISSPTMNSICNASALNDPIILSPCTSHHSPLSSVSQPEVDISLSTSGMTLQSTMSVSQQPSPQRNINSNVTMNTPQLVVTADLAMDTSTSTTSQMDREIQNSHSAGQFEQGSLSQVVATNQFEERSDTKLCENRGFVMTSQASVVVTEAQATATQVKKCEEGMRVPNEITQMSENDLISYINPSCFDTV